MICFRWRVGRVKRSRRRYTVDRRRGPLRATQRATSRVYRIDVHKVPSAREIQGFAAHHIVERVESGIGTKEGPTYADGDSSSDSQSRTLLKLLTIDRLARHSLHPYLPATCLASPLRWSLIDLDFEATKRAQGTTRRVEMAGV